MFDRVYVVHLPDSKRRAGMESELQRMGLTATFLHAQPPCATFTVTNMRRNPRAEVGVSLSHIKCVLRAIEDGAERPLFLEDDVRFLCEPARLAEVVAELPEAWDVCYFGGHPRGATQRVTASLVKVSTFSFAEAYAMTRKALRPFVDFWLDRFGQPNAMYDLVLGEFAAAHNGYCAFPLLTEQPPGYSTVGRKVDDKRQLVERGWRTNAP